MDCRWVNFDADVGKTRNPIHILDEVKCSNFDLLPYILWAIVHGNRVEFIRGGAVYEAG